MDRLKHIISICNSYKEGKYSVEEFQSWLSTALWPEPETEIAKGLEKLINMEYLMEELEGTRFLYGNDKAYEVADTIIYAITQVTSSLRE